MPVIVMEHQATDPAAGSLSLYFRQVHTHNVLTCRMKRFIRQAWARKVPATWLLFHASDFVTLRPFQVRADQDGTTQVVVLFLQLHILVGFQNEVLCLTRM